MSQIEVGKDHRTKARYFEGSGAMWLQDLTIAYHRPSRLPIMQTFVTQIVSAWHRRSFLAKLFSFASIGVVNVVVDVSIFTFLVQVLHVQLIPANILAWVIAVTGSYMMNSKITFGHVTGGLLSVGRYLRFAATGILGVIVATTVLVVLSNYTNIFAAKFASIATAFVVNFCMSHFFVFRDTSGRAE